MNIKLIREIRGSAIDISVEKGIAVEELYRQYKRFAALYCSGCKDRQ